METDTTNKAGNIYECSNCGHRVTAEHQPVRCPVCGSDMIDISRRSE